MADSLRSTIFVEDAAIISQTTQPAEQYILRVHAPECAAHALPGSFAHLRCDPLLPMRRPMSIMRVDAQKGWVEFLYKVAGQGTRLLAARKPRECINLLGPIGRPFEIHAHKPRPLLLGGGVGISPLIFLTDRLRHQAQYSPLMILGSEIPFPFHPRPSTFLLPTLPANVIAAIPLLEDWNIPSRLTSLQGYPGCYEGFVTDLARIWLENLPQAQRDEVEIFACGPRAMLKACTTLAIEFNLSTQVSLEEFMACGVGGCAGCTVMINTTEGPVMKRVCVDGPVFQANSVIF